MRPVLNNQVQVALDRQLTQFRGKENFDKLITLFLQEVASLEDTYFDLLNNRSIFTAVGLQLDLIGKILGQGRLGRDDGSYRAALLRLIAIGNSSGTPNDILDLLATYTQANSTRIWEHDTGCFLVLTDGDTRINGTSKDLLADIKPAGVKDILIHEDLGTEIIPLWEVHTPQNDIFQVFISGQGLFDLEITSEGEVFDFAVNFGQVTYESPEPERAIPLWLEPYDFELSDGSNLGLSTGEDDILSVVSSLLPQEDTRGAAIVNGSRLTNEDGTPVDFVTQGAATRASMMQVVQPYTT